MDPKPTTKEAVGLLRQWRVNREKKRGNCLGFLQRIERVIDDYCDRYEMDRADIAENLRSLADSLEEPEAQQEAEGAEAA